VLDRGPVVTSTTSRCAKSTVGAFGWLPKVATRKSLSSFVWSWTTLIVGLAHCAGATCAVRSCQASGVRLPVPDVAK